MAVQGCTAEPAALLKVLAHALKFHASTVNGVLLGSVPESGKGRISVKDVIPLCHTATTLAPALETGLALAQAYAQQTAKLQVVGYYVSDAKFNNAPTELTPLSKRIADRIADVQPACMVLVLDNKRLKDFYAESKGCPFDLYRKDAAKGWKRVQSQSAAQQEEAVTSSPPTSPTAAGADSKGAGNEESGSRGSTSAAVDLAGGASWSILHQELSAMRQAGRYRDLSDVDEHLDDVTKDFTNVKWSAQGKFALPGQAL